MKRTLLLLCLLLPLSTPRAFADDASKRAKVQELFQLLHLDSLMQQVMTQAMQSANQVVGSMGSQKLSSADQAIVNRYLDRVQKACLDVFGWKELEPAFTDLYIQTYSEDEIDGMLTFYKSPVGQSMIAKTPELTRRSSAITTSRLPQLQQQMQSITSDFQQELTRAHQQNPATPSKT